MNRLQERRMVLGLTQPQVSARLKETEPRADVGMVSRYEKGRMPADAGPAQGPGGCPGSVQDGTLRRGGPGPAGGAADSREPQRGQRDGDRTAHRTHRRFRKCYRISREFAASLPDDLLQVCGYSSWQSWHDAALKRLLGEYAARKRATKKEDKTA